MTKYRFKTNISCNNCKAKVQKEFEGSDLYESFDVDFLDPERKATFIAKDGVSREEIMRRIDKAGYKAEPIE